MIKEPVCLKKSFRPNVIIVEACLLVSLLQGTIGPSFGMIICDMVYYSTAQSANRRVEESKEHNILDCIECGCCFFSCPANKPLTDEIRLGKNKVRAMMAAKK